MSSSRSSGLPGTPSPREQYPDVSALIPRQRPASEHGAGPGGSRRRTARRDPEDARPRRRWSPLLAAGSVVLGTACVGVGVVSTDSPSGVSELSVTETNAPEMNAPGELAPAPVPPAPPAPPGTARAQPPGVVPVAAPLVRVRYELDGAPFARMISFTSGQASPVTDLTRVRLPWRKEFDAAGGFVPSVSVQGAGPGAISCRIMVDGELVSAVTVEGTNAVATCTAQALVESR